MSDSSPSNQKVQRWGYTIKPSTGEWVFEKLDTGAWVGSVDYDLLQAERDRLAAENAEIIKYRDDEFQLRDQLAVENTRLWAAAEGALRWLLSTPTETGRLIHARDILLIAIGTTQEQFVEQNRDQIIGATLAGAAEETKPDHSHDWIRAGEFTTQPPEVLEFCKCGAMRRRIAEGAADSTSATTRDTDNKSA